MSAEIVVSARRWLGTPYRHQASRRAIGTDCLGLIRGIWRERHGPEPMVVPEYTRDWSEAGGEETLLLAAAQLLHPVDMGAARSGDVVVFRMRRRAVAKHLGILDLQDPAHPQFIHAYEPAGVVASALTAGWHRRIARVFRFPERSI